MHLCPFRHLTTIKLCIVMFSPVFSGVQSSDRFIEILQTEVKYASKRALAKSITAYLI